MNRIILCGRLVSDVEIKKVSETYVLKGTIAVNRPKHPEGAQECDFIPFEYWGKNVDKLGAKFGKGNRVIIQGALHLNNYKTNEGKPATWTSVLVDNLEIVDWKDKSNNTQNNRSLPEETAGVDSPYYNNDEDVDEEVDEDIPF